MRSLFISDLFDVLVSESFGHAKSKTDYIVETDESFEIEIDMPGVTKDSIEIDIENDYLNIRATRKKQDTTTKEYMKSYKLGGVVNQSDIKAKYEDGVLKVSVGKKEKPKAKKITIE